MFSNWCQVGKIGSTNSASKQRIAVHLDTNVDLSGEELTCARNAVDICVDAHRRLMPNVPAIGWDVGVADGMAQCCWKPICCAISLGACLTSSDICASLTFITPMLAEQAHRVAAMRMCPALISTVVIEE